MPAGNGGSVPGPADAVPRPKRGWPKRKSWGDLRVRVLSAALLAPLGLIGIWLGGWVWAVLVVAAVAGMAREWIGLCRVGAGSFAGWAVPAIALAAVMVAAAGLPAVALGVVLLGALSVRMAGRRAALAVGIPYVALGGIALVWLRECGTAGLADALFVILLVWASDIGAYLAGRVVGGPKLAPRISPGKTWSGAVGGLVAAMLAGLAVAAVAGLGPDGSAALRALLVAGVLGVVSQAGDLLESAVKRHFGVKDSGGLIPGHGGLLDRLDGLLTAAPLAGLIALGTGGGVPLWR